MTLLLRPVFAASAALLVLPSVCLRPAQAQTNAVSAQKAAQNSNAPHAAAIYTIAPDVLAVVLDAGAVVPSTLAPYVLQTGDTRKETKDPQSLDGLGTVRLVRGGREIGWLIGPKRDTLVTDEAFAGSPLDAAPSVTISHLSGNWYQIAKN